MFATMSRVAIPDAYIAEIPRGGRANVGEFGICVLAFLHRLESLDKPWGGSVGDSGGNLGVVIEIVAGGDDYRGGVITGFCLAHTQIETVLHISESQ